MTPQNSGFTRQMAAADFERAFRKGFWRALISWMTLRDTRLQPFDEVLKQIRIRGQHSIGMQTVPLDQVVGSVGRFKDFDNIFLPRQTHTRDRWLSIDEAHLRDIPLPAIELYKVGDRYYVKDGNHRVSVARERGQEFIDAYVIEMQLDEVEDKDLDLIEQIHLREKQIFLAKTHMADLFPGLTFEATVANGYAMLLEHIEVHGWFISEHTGREIAWEEAVRSWVNEVYLPLIAVIHRNKVMEHFPDRTETDLYLWIIEHLWYLREAYQDEVSLEQAADHFTEEFSKKPLNWLLRFIRRISRRGNEDSMDE